MHESPIVNTIGIVGTLAFLGAGLAFSPICDGGYTLMLFAAAVMLLGVLFFRWGAWATMVPFALAALTLFAGGWYGLTITGCGV